MGKQSPRTLRALFSYQLCLSNLTFSAPVLLITLHSAARCDASPFTDEAQTALFKDPVRTAQ